MDNSQLCKWEHQALGEGVDVAEGLEAGEIRSDSGDHDAD